MEVGITVAHDLVDDGARLLVTGDMGIANTTASAALISALTGLDPAAVTGRGTGLDDAGLAHKVAVVRQALAVNHAGPGEPLRVLAAVGGLEHAALTGFLLGAAERHTPVVLDGVIAVSAALVARRPGARRRGLLGRGAPLRRARCVRRPRPPGAQAAGRPRAAPGRGLRRRPRRAAGAGGRPGPARGGDFRLGRRDRQELTACVGQRAAHGSRQVGIESTRPAGCSVCPEGS